MVLVSIRVFRNRHNSVAKYSSSDEVSSTDSKYLHGVNLDKYHYLGFVTLKFDEVENNVFQFCNKENFQDRKYVVKGLNADECKKYHHYVTKLIDPWSIGENEIYHYVYNGRSKFINEYMLEHFNSVWSEEKKWWISTEESKMNGATLRQKKEKATKASKTDVVSDTISNIITVDFKKKTKV